MFLQASKNLHYSADTCTMNAVALFPLYFHLFCSYVNRYVKSPRHFENKQKKYLRRYHRLVADWTSKMGK